MERGRAPLQPDVLIILVYIRSYRHIHYRSLELPTWNNQLINADSFILAIQFANAIFLIKFIRLIIQIDKKRWELQPKNIKIIIEDINTGNLFIFKYSSARKRYRGKPIIIRRRMGISLDYLDPGYSTNGNLTISSNNRV